MEFKFNPKQQYQLDAINAVLGLFEGQVYQEAHLDSPLWEVLAVGNQLDLDDDQLLANVRAVQASHGLPPDEALLPTQHTLVTHDGESLSYPNFSIEMETGTGKTYCYLRTILELGRKYGFRKFIIVVPSVAIREGVLKTFKITQKHFSQLYDNLPYQYYEYNSGNLSQVRQFALAGSIQIMVMTIDAFNKNANVIRQSTDRLQGETPLHLIQATRPILILDEPQTKMEGESNKLAIGELMPLCTLRYSATHKTPYNRVYRLTPFEAYRQNLVKRVEVASITQEDDYNRAFIEVISITRGKRSMEAKLRVHKQQKSSVKQATITVKPGGKLFDKTQKEEYRAYVVDRIEYNCVVFTVGNRELEVCIGQKAGEDTQALWRAQLATAIEEHFRKQDKFKAQGIKVLSLFFISKVAHYRGEDDQTGIVRQIFDEEFNRLKARFPSWAEQHPDKVQSAYFAEAKKGVWKDSNGTSEGDSAAYDLILRDKERLLSFDEPVSFIFSHSALNEGWDNPNIFQICVLRDVQSAMTKRQQIGRGVRLAVNQSGDRIHDEQVNLLTVVASEGYTQFVKEYQAEFKEAYGTEATVPTLVNKREARTVQLQKRHVLSPEFVLLWDKIKHKTRYAVDMDTHYIIREAGRQLREAEIRLPRITAVKAEVVLTEGNQFEASQSSAVREMAVVRRDSQLPDLVRRIEHLLTFQSTPISLSRQTVLKILLESGRLADCVKNPHEAATVCVRLIQEVLADHLVNGIRYERLDDAYEMTLFEEEFQSWAQYLVPATKSVYDHVEYDSSIESDFVKAMEARNDIKLYVKLPAWFTVPTPVGTYNPDWAIVMDDPNHPDGEKLYLVRETKGDGELRPTERRKTDCGKLHFEELGVSYKIVNNANQLP
jgi:type III restriction enzyme